MLGPIVAFATAQRHSEPQFIHLVRRSERHLERVTLCGQQTRTSPATWSVGGGLVHGDFVPCQHCETVAARTSHLPVWGTHARIFAAHRALSWTDPLVEQER